MGGQQTNHLEYITPVDTRFPFAGNCYKKGCNFKMAHVYCSRCGREWTDRIVLSTNLGEK